MGYHSDDKKIVINTVFLYLQMFTTLFISLYTSRIVLNVVGVSDFGIYGVVGGVLAMFTFITGSLGTATARFFNAEMGKRNGDLNKIFNINQTLHFLFAICIFILSETIGLWYIYNKLRVPDGKLDDAVFVYQICIITTCLGINNTPWSSLFSSHEKFRFISVFEVGNLLLRFSCILFLQYYHGNALRLYAIIMCLTTVNSFLVYHLYGKKQWPEIVRFRFVRGWENYKPVLSFGGWNILSTISFMARATGGDLLLNSFFGTVVNGAFNVSKQANNHVIAFSTMFDAASGPQIIQSYNGGNYTRCYYLANKLGRIALLLFEIAFFPIYIELPFLLELWLGNVPDCVLTFMRINLISCGLSLTCGGFNQVISASGKIKWFKIEISTFFLLCIPLGYFLFKMGYPPYSLLLLFLFADVMQRMVQMILLKVILNFDSIKYMKEAWIRPFSIAIIMGFSLYLYGLLGVEERLYRLLSMALCFCIVVGLVFTIGLTTGERNKVVGKMCQKLHIHM